MLAVRYQVADKRLTVALRGRSGAVYCCTSVSEFKKRGEATMARTSASLRLSVSFQEYREAARGSGAVNDQLALNDG